MRSLLVLLFWCSAVFCSTEADVPDRDQFSECLKRCLRPLARLERSFQYVFNNFEKVCNLLDTGAECSVKCGLEDQRKFWQYSTFYRMHCVNYEEEIEEHLECLKTAAKDVDSVCKGKCHKTVDKTMATEEKQTHTCKALECSTVCYFEEFSNDCPDAQELLLNLSLQQIREIRQTIHPKNWDEMTHSCKDIHDVNYMKAAMINAA